MTGKRAFWISFGLSLAVVVPAYLALLAYQLVTPSVAADTPQTDIPVVFPTVQDDRTVLVMTGDGTAQTAQTYALVRLDALHERVAVATLPRETIVLRDGAPVALCDAVRESGPTQGVRSLEETLGVTIDNYLFAPPETLWTIADVLGTARIRLSSYISGEALEHLALAVDGVEELTLSPRLFAEVLASDDLTEDEACALRAYGYAAFLAAGQRGLAGLPDAVRGESQSIATDLTATQLYDYERLLNFLQSGTSLSYTAAPLPVTRGNTCELGENACEEARSMLEK